MQVDFNKRHEVSPCSFPQLDITRLSEYLTIRPVACKGAEWVIDPWPLRAKSLIVLVSPN